METHMANKSVRLTSQFNDGDREWVPGEIVEVNEKQADQIIAGRGGVEVKPSPKKPAAKKTTTKQSDK